MFRKFPNVAHLEAKSSLFEPSRLPIPIRRLSSLVITDWGLEVGINASPQNRVELATFLTFVSNNRNLTRLECKMRMYWFLPPSSSFYGSDIHRLVLAPLLLLDTPTLQFNGKSKGVCDECAKITFVGSSRCQVIDCLKKQKKICDECDGIDLKPCQQGNHKCHIACCHLQPTLCHLCNPLTPNCPLCICNLYPCSVCAVPTCLTHRRYCRSAQCFYVSCLRCYNSIHPGHTALREGDDRFFVCNSQLALYDII